MTKNTLLVDCQVFQSSANDRGMGKYSMELLMSIASVEGTGFDEYVLVFNSNLDRNPEAEETLLNSIPNSRVDFLDLRLAHNLFDTRKVRLKNQKTLTKYIDANNIEKSSFLILALFLYEICPAFPLQSTKYLLFYDLIPLLYFERYEASEISYPQNYLERFNIIFQSDKIFAISKTVANDMSVFLGMPHDIVESIDGASIQRVHLKSKKPKVVDQIGKKKYILMPSGEDLRKNNEEGVKGFELFNKKHNDEYALIITSTFSDTSKTLLKKLSSSVVFSDNVGEDELAWLYENCECVYFPTEYEGLGLPVLEAIDYNKPIACSNIPVFNEMSYSAFVYFDPHDSKDMAKALEEVATHEIKTSEYQEISKKYTWHNSAQKMIEHMMVGTPKPETANKPLIAIVCPDPTGYSAIGKVVAESHYELSQKFEIDYYFEVGKSHRKVRTTYLPAVAKCYPVEEFDDKTYAKYEHVIYHIGNSEYHAQTVHKALGLKGTLIIHDTNLSGLYGNMLENDNISKKRYEVEQELEKKLDAKQKGMLTSVVNNQILAICHSDYAKKTVQKHILTDTKVETVNLPVASSIFENQLRPKRAVNIGMAGIIAEVKGVNLLSALLEDSRFDNCNFYVIGHTFLGEKNTSWLNHNERVRLIGDPTDIDFQGYLSKLNILVNFRKKYNGETSLSTLEAMRHGVVPIVRKIGWYDELPDDVCVKIKSEDELSHELSELVSNPNTMNEMSKNAQSYISENYSHADYAKRMFDLLNSNSQPSLSANIPA